MSETSTLDSKKTAERKREENEERSKARQEPLLVWFEEEFARGRCDQWERFFENDLTVTTADGRVLSTLGDWEAAFARRMNDRPLCHATVTEVMTSREGATALFWEGLTHENQTVQGVFMATRSVDRIASLRCWETVLQDKTEERENTEDGALPDGNWWF